MTDENNTEHAVSSDALEGNSMKDAVADRIESARWRLSEIGYILLRSLELDSAWISVVADTDLKILLGEKIGYMGKALQEIAARLSELFDQAAPFRASRECATKLDGASGVDADGVPSFEGAFLADLENTIRSSVYSVCLPADEPSLGILRRMLDDVRHLRRNFQSSAGLGLFYPDPTCERIPYTSTEALPPLVSWPARAPSLRLTNQADIPVSAAAALGSLEAAQRLLHFQYIDVEISAAEVCARNIIQDRAMPIAFKIDMARQVWDEVRHAVIMRDLLVEAGGTEGMFPYDGAVWTKILQAVDLPEKLAIEQVIQEGNALDALPNLIAAVERAGNVRAANLLRYVQADEIVHVGFGNKWLKRLLSCQEDSYEAYLQKVAAKFKVPLPGAAAPDEVARMAAGFEPAFVEKLSRDHLLREIAQTG